MGTFFLAALFGFRAAFASVDWKTKDEQFWKQHLTPEQFKICREKGTEPAFSGKFTLLKDKGIYHCALCGQPVFSSEKKFDSGTGWASFTQSLSDGSVELRSSKKFFVTRTEVICSGCGAHLGFVYDDGPSPTGKRYGINSVCLSFAPNEKSAQ